MKLLIATGMLIAGSLPASAQLYRGPALSAPTLAERCGGQQTATVPKTTARPQKLGDEPPASRLYTLYRSVDGCPRSIVLQDGIGANRHKARPIAPGLPQARPLR
jgi:hypothetical protein